MRIQDIEPLFDSEETLDKVLEKCKEDFNLIDYWSGVRKNNITDNSAEIRKALNELSGCYANLRVILAIAESEKKNREVKFYESLKIETENDGKKFVSTVADKQASGLVASYRRIRNIVSAYLESCDKHIITLQSILKDIGKDYNHPQE